MERSYKKCRVVKGGLRVHLIPKVAHSSLMNTLGDEDVNLVFPWEESDDYRIMVVRHPLDRIVSSWAFFNYKRPTHLLTEYIAKAVGEQIPMSFESWCVGILENYDYNAHFDKQVIFTGGQEIDLLIKMENLDKEWPAIAKRFGLPSMRSENSSDHKHWSEYYTPALRKLAETIFAEDIILYNSAR